MVAVGGAWCGVVVVEGVVWWKGVVEVVVEGWGGDGVTVRL